MPTCSEIEHTETRIMEGPSGEFIGRVHLESSSGMNNRGKSMWRTSPGGGGASGGMVAHDLVNGCQAAA